MESRPGSLALEKFPSIVLLLLVLLTSLPFAQQAFHIDDRIYLEVAGNILQQPLFPYDYPTVFEGLVTPDAASHSHLPLTSYYLAFVYLLTGSQSEWVYHLAFLIFPILAALAFFDLARRFVHHPLAAGCLLILAPVFTVLSHSLMTDVPLLAFWLLSLSRLMRIYQEGGASWRDWLVLILSVGAAAMISLLTMGLMLLAWAFLLLETPPSSRPERRRVIKKLAIVFLLPFLVWLIWYFRAYLYYDRFVLVNTVLHIGKRQGFGASLLGFKFVSFILNVGGIFIFPLAIWYGLVGTWKTRIAALFFCLSLVPFYLFSLEWTWPNILLFGIFFSSGGLIFWEILTCLKSSSMRLMALWFFGILGACLVLFYSGSARYTLLALPPVVLVWIRGIETRVREAYFRKNLIWSGVILTGLYSISLSYADYQFAGIYREAARQIIQDYSSQGRTIWFTGEWGFRYYLEQEGARLVTRTQLDPRPGDLIVKPFVASPWITLYDGGPYTSLVEQRQLDMSMPIRLLDFKSHAGFYSTGWGILPFAFSTGEPWEWINVFRVEQKYTGPVPEAETHW